MARFTHYDGGGFDSLGKMAERYGEEARRLNAGFGKERSRSLQLIALTKEMLRAARRWRNRGKIYPAGR